MGKKKSKSQLDLSGELNKYEELLSNSLWAAMLLIILSDACVGYVLGQVVFRTETFLIQLFLFAAIIVTSIIRMCIIRKEELKRGLLYASMKLLDIVLIILLISTLRYGVLFYFLVLLPIISICITEGYLTALGYLGFGFVMQTAVRQVMVFFHWTKHPEFLIKSNWEYYCLLFILYFIFTIFLRIVGLYHNQFVQSEKDNQNLVGQLGRKFAQLEETKAEKQDQYDKLKEVNLRLEDSNKKLTSSLAEFFTLQQISQAISSIFDMDELLQFVNDIIIGVMGVSTSNIALYGSGDRLKVQVSSILNKKDRAILTDNINTPVLKDAIDQGQSIINNNVNPEQYAFTKGRNVKSLMCVPLQIKGKAHGLVLIEHSISEAFDEDNIRLLEIITQQVSIAIENARLYEQLQEFANTDGLTQVYNRIFFQNRLAEELLLAQQEGFELSVILYDIDNFKRFNDSYGHLFGDIVLKSLAQLVKESIRKDDIVARFGGEEFIILLPHTGKDQAFEKAEELRKKIAVLVVKDKTISASVTVSMGVSTFPALAMTETALLSSADEALYAAKASGKNCVKIAGE